MRVATYTRVSTEDQAREGFSLPAQKDRLEAFCSSQGWNIVEHYTEEGQSAKNLDRPELQRLLSDIKNGGIEIVLVYRLDRLTRSVLDLYTLLKVFEGSGVGFRSATEVYDTTTAMGRLFITLVAALAQWERENLSERISFGMAQMARSGKRPGTKEPYGYKFVGGSQLDIIQGEAETVRLIFKLSLSGLGQRKTAEYLNQRGIPSKTGKLWIDSTIWGMLRNPLYLGKFAWNGELYPSTHPPIIDEETFSLVQNKIEQRKELPPRHASSIYPLTGVLHCGLCDGPMNGKIVASRGKMNRLYGCSRRDKNKSCSMRRISADNLERKVLEHIQGIIASDEAKEAFRAKHETPDQDDSRARLTASLEALAGRRKKLIDAYEAGVLGMDDLKDRISSMQEQEIQIKKELSALTDNKMTFEVLIESLGKIVELWDDIEPLERKALMHDCVRKITLLTDRNIKVLFA